jgi:hypothetical protein
MLKYQSIVPLFYEHSAVQGITLWGYQQSDIYSKGAQLLNGTTERPAMTWLKQYFAGTYKSPPVAQFSITSQTSSIINLSGASSYDNDGNILSYSWNFGDGSSIGSGVTTSHTYSTSGIYTILLTVTDNDQLTSTYSKTVTMAVPLANCHNKFVGNTIKYETVDKYFDLYWNQVTPEYLGKWTST